MFPTYYLGGRHESENMGLSRVVWATFIDWCHDTSIAGISKTVQSRSYFKKIYWLILFIIGAYFTISNTISTFEDYFLYEVSTSNDLTFNNSVQFPAVSICNQNRLVLIRGDICIRNLVHFSRLVSNAIL